ncbi:MAG: DNA repair protein RecO [Alphaproteobacteria bacterium]|nr:DNA repair protein RecO [Alphaproteobacteria bacterium]
MKIETVGILIALRPFSERDCVARIFTPDNGVLVGVLRGAAVAKKNRVMVGQYGAVSWGARLESQLGVFRWDVEKNPAGAIMMNSNSVLAMNAAFDVLNALLPEREAYQNLYAETLLLLQRLGNADFNAYLDWEIALLRELGYALDLSVCAGCGAKDDLCYLSPRTGRAVCAKCAMPYIDKLYKLPLGLDITVRFLESICVDQGVQFPIGRRMLKFD